MNVLNIAFKGRISPFDTKSNYNEFIHLYPDMIVNIFSCQGNQPEASLGEHRYQQVPAKMYKECGLSAKPPSIPPGTVATLDFFDLLSFLSTCRYYHSLCNNKEIQGILSQRSIDCFKQLQPSYKLSAPFKWHSVYPILMLSQTIYGRSIGARSILPPLY